MKKLKACHSRWCNSDEILKLCWGHQWRNHVTLVHEVHIKSFVVRHFLFTYFFSLADVRNLICHVFLPHLSCLFCVDWLHCSGLFLYLSSWCSVKFYVYPGFVSCGHAWERCSQSYFCGGHAVPILLHRMKSDIKHFSSGLYSKGFNKQGVLQ